MDTCHQYLLSQHLPTRIAIGEPILQPGHLLATKQLSVTVIDSGARGVNIDDSTNREIGIDILLIPGYQPGVQHQQISVLHTSHGQPQFACEGKIACILSDRGVSGSHLSLADEKDYAVAYVVLEC